MFNEDGVQSASEPQIGAAALRDGQQILTQYAPCQSRKFKIISHSYKSYRSGSQDRTFVHCFAGCGDVLICDQICSSIITSVFSATTSIGWSPLLVALVTRLTRDACETVCAQDVPLDPASPQERHLRPNPACVWTDLNPAWRWSQAAVPLESTADTSSSPSAS